MTKHGAIAKGERRVREMLGKSYKVTRQIKTRDYILLGIDRPTPAGFVVVATIASDGTVTELRPE